MENTISICLVASSAPTYRKEIFTRLANEIGCRFILGTGPTKQMDKNTQPGVVATTRTVHIGKSKLCWHPGVLKNTKGYNIVIIDLEIFSVSGWLLLLLAKLRKQKTYIWGHGWYGREGTMKKIIKKVRNSLCTGLLLYGDRAKRLMIEAGYKEEKLHVIHNSLAYSEQLPLRKSMQSSNIYQAHFNNQNKNIVFIGRLRKVKRFDLLIDAIAELWNRGEEVNVTFIGDGEEKSGMEKRVKELGIQENVWFYGACFDEKTNAELIYNADLCVSPGNIGLTAMHVLMFGCPAITNDDFEHQMPEFEAINEGITGAFFKAGDSHSLAESISNWFFVHKDDRENVRKACYNEIDTKWNTNVQIEILKNVLLG